MAEPEPSPSEREAQRDTCQEVQLDRRRQHPEEPCPFIGSIEECVHAAVRFFQRGREAPAFYVRESRESRCDPKTGLMRSRRHALSSAHAVAILAPEEVFG